MISPIAGAAKPVSEASPKPGHQMRELLYQALASDLGIVVETNDVERTRAKLYAARREANDPALEILSFTPSRTSPETQLWIVKRTEA